MVDLGTPLLDGHSVVSLPSVGGAKKVLENYVSAPVRLQHLKLHLREQ